MSRVWVRASIEDAYITAELEGWVEPDVWRTACDECAVPIHVTRVLSLRVKTVGGGWFTWANRCAFECGRLSKPEAAIILRRRWLADDEGWRPRVLGAELSEVRAPGSPPGAVLLLEVPS